MTLQQQPLVWRAVVRGVIIVYIVAFVAGLVLAALGITPQSEPGSYPLIALLMGAIAVAVALRMTDSTRPASLVALGAGIWLLSVTSVLVGAQSLTDWLQSSMSIATTMLLGRLLLGVTVDDSPAQSPYATIVRSMTQTRRNV
jgi:hypothetical protein